MAGAEMLKTRVILSGFRKVLYESGYPAIHRSQAGHVQGELYRVTLEHLKRLDRFEECPELYQREALMLDSGEIAFAYVISYDAGSELPDYTDDAVDSLHS
jgi:gamma-glutamylcyclotransferase (GGCT)/AIG2-like uncharacterized protein YtfP